MSLSHQVKSDSAEHTIDIHTTQNKASQGSKIPRGTELLSPTDSTPSRVARPSIQNTQSDDSTSRTSHLAPQESGNSITDWLLFAVKGVVTAPGKIIRTITDPNVLLPLMMLTAPYARAAALGSHAPPDSFKPETE